MIEENVIYNRLKAYGKRDIAPMHMPGHKRNGKALRNGLPYGIDITEISGFDNLQNPSGILKDSMDIASKLFGSVSTHYTVNGSTAGILASIRAVVGFGDEIVVARNCHKAVYNAIELMGLDAQYIVPTIDQSGVYQSITATQVESALKRAKNPKAVVIVSPSYEGVISNVSAIAKVCHRHGAVLIVDEAHGAHLFLENKSATTLGADIVINSLHKTLPSLTGTAVVSVCSSRVNSIDIQRELGIFASSSPSYILLASIDSCVRWLCNHGNAQYQQYKAIMDKFDHEMEKLTHLRVLCKGQDKDRHSFYDFDFGKVVISTAETNISGDDLMTALRAKGIECEMCYSNYVIAMTTLMDRPKTIARLAKALLDIDHTLVKAERSPSLTLDFVPKKKYSANKARDMQGESVDILDAVGRVSKDYIWVYPPETPLVCAGEVISKEVVDTLQGLQSCGLDLHTSSDNYPQVTVVKKGTKL